MCAIPRGRTRTYGEVARKLGRDDARAVGQACGDNRLPIVIPCHRVVAADGIGGFSHTTERISDRGQALAARPRDAALTSSRLRP